MKRGLSDSDSDCDDVFDDSIKAGSPSQSCQISDRKRRRGVIEKRRRDRINSSLSELRRLVPSAFEKQGSAKLEKAEILQMTVDHLKMLHQKGLNSYNYDPHNLAKDYRFIGFKECAAEVARYLVAVEGLDLQDPLRMRLLSHLQCFSSQRDSVAKAAAATFHCGGAPPPPPSAWTTPAPAFNSHQYPSVMPSAAAAIAGSGSLMGSGHLGAGSLGAGSSSGTSLGAAGGGGPGSLLPQVQTAAGDLMISSTSSSSSSSSSSSNAVTSSLLNMFSADVRGIGGIGDVVGGSLGGGGGGCGGGVSNNPRLGSASMALTSSSSSSSLSSSALVSSIQTASMSPPVLHSLSQFHHPHPHHQPHQFPTTAGGGGGGGAAQSLGQLSGVKPYRPWGGELAY
ncbi:uncharacterized protein LOC143276844 [Babylonia areolata]|uniref:uncharacterized protein LOC143276844 n=1 Tax=Babylonia areolata TaxID=304850 RepID=UPI003FD55DCD